MENALDNPNTVPKSKKSMKKQKTTWKHKQDYDGNDETQGKKPKVDGEQDWPFRKKKVALLLVYSGKGYLGMQRNPGFRTIESELFDALLKAGVVRPDHIEEPRSKMSFQRAARTDKGVSAAGQVVSFKMFVDVEDAVGKINSHLPAQIHVLGIKRTTKTFDCKNSCTARTYTYLTPSFAFAPMNETVCESYRITKDVLTHLQDILNCFCGTHNFHNFTSGKKSGDASAQRYIMEFKVGDPFIRDDIEYVKLTVKGQSFMLHQIRKMTGIAMAICRSFVNMDILKKSWGADKVDIPKAPGLGLVLDQLHYNAYNKKFGTDGMHEAIEWSQYKEEIEEFKENFIYSTIFQTEKEEKSMMKWLGTLHLHHFDYITGHLYNTLPLVEAKNNLKEPCNNGPQTVEPDEKKQKTNANLNLGDESSAILEKTERSIDTSLSTDKGS
ncbi:hypothetical protein HELRODRAFT_154673 [Helobdella robusta]|uniref:Pseudouridylate synthase 1 homolog n=1 Tax=Helobdella robusta TaxID=6412 RepID=T1ELF5_HELRO|nr:hypothetical protein HELRODRAFT_154673 [Helobdella robusta]ESO05692.1 hypothetical protein HELRODRAFT_154673 [Helobdella robusta]